MNPDIWVIIIPPGKDLDHLMSREDFELWQIKDLLPNSFCLAVAS